MIVLGEYIRDAVERPFRWGDFDCVIFCADWVVAQGGPDPMAHVRGTYEGETGALRALKRRGGLVKLWTRAMKKAGIADVVNWQDGDIGIIERPTMDGANFACAICTGTRWVTLGVNGIDGGPANPIKVWRV